MLHYLVLGGNGYLGAKIIELLADNEHKVVCTVRNQTLRKDFKKQNVRVIPASLDSIETAFQYNDFDMVINAVCNYGRSEVLYGDVIEANVEFPIKVLDMSVANGVKKFVTIGTGLPDDLNMYTYSKKVFSEFGKFYVEKQNIDFIVMKLEMFYGFDEPVNRFLPGVIRKMLSGEEINVTLGTQHRDIISVNDVIYAIKTVINSDLSGYHEIPVGSGVAPTIAEIIEYLNDITDKKSVVNFGAVPMRKNEPDSVADTELLKDICDWDPVFWKTGLKNMVEQIKETL